MACTNPNCRHRTKRKLRPLVISLTPPSDGNGVVVDSPFKERGSVDDKISSRREQITSMFATHPSLSAHFEPPVFSPGVPQRDLRARLKLLEHFHNVGLIPDVEWREIRRAVDEQVEEAASDVGIPDPSNGGVHYGKHRVIDPFRYLAVETNQSNGDCIDDEDNQRANSSRNGKGKKKKRWVECRTKSLVPISPGRKGSDEDRALPYSMELWRKAKTLNRDRSVLACTLAHLIAMKTLVGEDGNGGPAFDFILEDNVRAFVGLQCNEYSSEGKNRDSNEWTGWSCECSNRIWDCIEASNESPSECHMRYYGWLSSLPNMTWIHEKHIPRTAFGTTGSNSTIFPFPTHEDFDLDSIDPTSEQEMTEESEATPQFITPGGTAPVWGTFAYTVSRMAYKSLLDQLGNDVGSLVWKGKRMRAYLAKPIDKILPRHVKSTYGAASVHLPERIAFVRAPMLGSLLHPQWEEGFCLSTEAQYHMCMSNSGSNENGLDVWDNVWLTQEEKRTVGRRRIRGEWIHQHDSDRNPSRRRRDCPIISQAVSAAVIVAIISLLSSEHTPVQLVPIADAFASNTIRHHYNNQRYLGPLSGTQLDDSGLRKRGKIGEVPIISRTIPIEIESPLSSIKNGDGVDDEKLEITVWEMDKPSDLIQEWWSIDESERSSRIKDPFGVVMWPGSVVAAMELMKKSTAIRNATVLVLGAGTGVEAQAAALLGAKKVIATDINPLTLKLLKYGAENDDRIDGDSLEGIYFDIFSPDPLPQCDVLLAADVLYNPELASQVGKRVHEGIVRSFDEGLPPLKVIVTDSQRFHGTNFLEEVVELVELNSMFRETDWEQLKWGTQKLQNVSGSGVLVDEDQIYDVEVRTMCWGWQP